MLFQPKLLGYRVSLISADLPAGQLVRAITDSEYDKAQGALEKATSLYTTEMIDFTAREEIGNAHSKMSS